MRRQKKSGKRITVYSMSHLDHGLMDIFFFVILSICVFLCTQIQSALVGGICSWLNVTFIAFYFQFHCEPPLSLQPANGAFQLSKTRQLYDTSTLQFPGNSERLFIDREVVRWQSSVFGFKMEYLNTANVRQ